MIPDRPYGLSPATWAGLLVVLGFLIAIFFSNPNTRVPRLWIAFILALVLVPAWLTYLRGRERVPGFEDRARRRRHRLASRIRRRGRPRVFAEPGNEDFTPQPPTDELSIDKWLLILVSLFWSVTFGFAAWLYSAPHRTFKENVGALFLIIVASLPALIWFDLSQHDPHELARRARRWLRLGRKV